VYLVTAVAIDSSVQKLPRVRGGSSPTALRPRLGGCYSQPQSIPGCRLIRSITQGYLIALCPELPQSSR